MKKIIVLGLVLATAIVAQGAQRIVMEAEATTTIEAPFAVVAEGAAGAVAGASGGYLEIAAGKGKPPEEKDKIAKVTYAFEVEAEDAFVLWLRVYWEGECNNSFNARFDEGPQFLIGETPTFKKWHWVKFPVARNAAPVRLAKGSHTLTLFHRQDGVRVDQILLTTDRRYVPVEIEKK